MSMQQFCLRWNNHQPNFISVFSSLLNSESLVDVTLAAEGRHLQAHKVVLSACSSYFQSLFTVNPCQHPIVILKDVKFMDLKVMVDFMYYGEVNVSQEQLPHILKTAEMLKIKGLAEMPDSTSLTKSQSGSTDRAELLTPGDSNWSSDALRRSLSPSPCPLSPGSRRKRLRKSSTGSGSGSTERTSEEHPNEAQLTSPSGSLVNTHIKQDPGFASDCSTPQRTVKQHSSDSEPHRDSSQESVEGDTSHQITLQIPQQSEISLHNMEPASVDIVGPSASSGCPQPPVTGLQWAFLEHTYPRFAPSMTHPSSDNQYHTPSEPAVTSCTLSVDNVQSSSAVSPCHSVCQSPCASPSPNQNGHTVAPVKRKRSVNPQADENFVRALEAVRFGGIGFCKAARMYGVNNRTLWLEYKKRGYPVSRLSIKSRIKQDSVASQQTPSSSVIAEPTIANRIAPPPPPPPVPVICPPAHSVTMIGAAFPDYSSALQRNQYQDTTILSNPNSHIAVQGLNYNQM